MLRKKVTETSFLNLHNGVIGVIILKLNCIKIFFVYLHIDIYSYN